MPTPSLSDLPRVLASAIQTPRSLRLSSPDPLSLAEAQAKLRQTLGSDDRPMRREATPLALLLLDAAVWTFRLPAELDLETRRRLSRAGVEHFYENVWIHIPRHGLDGRSPLEAAQAAATGDAIARAKLAGIISLREQLGARPTTAELYGGYPFDRLRSRLGIAAVDANTLDANDVSCMSALNSSTSSRRLISTTSAWPRPTNRPRGCGTTPVRRGLPPPWLSGARRS